MRGLAALAFLLAWSSGKTDEAPSAAMAPEWSRPRRLGRTPFLGTAVATWLFPSPAGNGMNLFYFTWNLTGGSGTQTFWLRARDSSGNWRAPEVLPLQHQAVSYRPWHTEVPLLLGWSKESGLTGMRYANGTWEEAFALPPGEGKRWPAVVRESGNGDLLVSWLDEAQGLHQAVNPARGEWSDPLLVAEDVRLLVATAWGDWAIRLTSPSEGEGERLEATMYWQRGERLVEPTELWRGKAKSYGHRVSGLVASTEGKTPLLAWLLDIEGPEDEVWSSALEPGGAWMPPQLLGKVYGWSDLRVVTAATGDGYVLWEGIDGLVGAHRSLEGEWISIPLLLDGGFIGHSSFAPMPDGRLLALWQSSKRRGLCSGALTSYTMTPGEGWSRPTAVSRSCLPAYDPEVAVGGNGEVVVVWTHTFAGSYMWWAALDIEPPRS